MKRKPDPFKEPEFTRALMRNEKRFEKRRAALREMERITARDLQITVNPVEL